MNNIFFFHKKTRPRSCDKSAQVFELDWKIPPAEGANQIVWFTELCLPAHWEEKIKYIYVDIRLFTGKETNACKMKNQWRPYQCQPPYVYKHEELQESKYDLCTHHPQSGDMTRRCESMVTCASLHTETWLKAGYLLLCLPKFNELQ